MQPTPILCLLSLLPIGLLACFVLAACVQSGNDAEAERRADTLAALAALPGSAHYDTTEHNDD